ncbi:MAG TPA: potassium channel family protein [Burkholderiales bacterium]|nr:potassium channel family protein [Burkholderiales bacterium]
MYDNWTVNAVVVAITAAAVAGTVALHYGGLEWMSRKLLHIRHHRRSVLYAIFGALALHIAEIWLFGFGYWLLQAVPEAGVIQGMAKDLLLDCVYFSATVYSTVGFGDLSPVGPIRFVAGTESLTGFVMIGWTASFTYLEMERRWRSRS